MYVTNHIPLVIDVVLQSFETSNAASLDGNSSWLFISHPYVSNQNEQILPSVACKINLISSFTNKD